MAASRPGSDMLALQPLSFRVPGELKGGEVIGANTLVGVRNADGYYEQYVAGTVYNDVLVADREFDATGEADGDMKAPKGIRKNIAIKLETDVNADLTWLGQTAHALDEHTATLSTDDGAGTNYSQLGPVVEVVDANYVYVLVQ